MMEPAAPPPTERRALRRARLLESAYQLDAWLKEHIGRPYTAMLGAGIALGIAATVKSLESAVETGRNVFVLAATVVFEAALLINQLAQLHEYRQTRRARRDARAEVKRPPTA